MPLITRISRLFRADFNAVLDNIEEPSVLLRQAIREMEEDLLADEQQLKWLKHERAELDARKAELTAVIDQVDSELSLCFESGKDDLARGLVKRKLETQKLQQRILNRADATTNSIEQLETRIREHSSALENLRQKAALFAETSKPQHYDGTNVGSEWMNDGVIVCDDDVEVALLREKKLRSS